METGKNEQRKSAVGAANEELNGGGMADSAGTAGASASEARRLARKPRPSSRTKRPACSGSRAPGKTKSGAKGGTARKSAAKGKAIKGEKSAKKKADRQAIPRAKGPRLPRTPDEIVHYKRVLELVENHNDLFLRFARSRRFQWYNRYQVSRHTSGYEPEDIAQKARFNLAKYWYRVPTEPGAFEACAYTAVLNVFRDILAQLRLRQKLDHEYEETSEHAAEVKTYVQHSEPDNARTALMKEEMSAAIRNAIDEALAELEVAKPRHAKAWRMHKIEGYSHEEIAEKLGCSKNSSRQYVSQARKSLQKQLGSWETVREQFIAA